MNNKIINFIGPIMFNFNFEVEDENFYQSGLQYTAINSSRSFEYGIFKQALFTSNLGYKNNLIAFIGSDEMGDKIMENIREENLTENIVILPGNTCINIKINNFFQYLYLLDHNFNTNIFKKKIDLMEDSGLVYMHFGMSPDLRKYVINHYKSSIKISRNPLTDRSSLGELHDIDLLLLNTCDIDLFSVKEEENIFSKVFISTKISTKYDVKLVFINNNVLYYIENYEIYSLNIIHLPFELKEIEDIFTAGFLIGLSEDDDIFRAVNIAVVCTWLHKMNLSITNEGIIHYIDLLPQWIEVTL